MKFLCAQFKWTVSCWYTQWRSSELVMYMAWCIFILQNKSTVYIFLLINSCMKFVSWIFFFSCTIFWLPTSICPTRFLFCFLFCIIVSLMLAKMEFSEVYRVLWVLEFVDTDLEDHHLQIKYFTSIKATRVSVNSSLALVWAPKRMIPWNSPVVWSAFQRYWHVAVVNLVFFSRSLDTGQNSLQRDVLPCSWIKEAICLILAHRGLIKKYLCLIPLFKACFCLFVQLF